MAYPAIFPEACMTVAFFRGQTCQTLEVPQHSQGLTLSEGGI